MSVRTPGETATKKPSSEFVAIVVAALGLYVGQCRQTVTLRAEIAIVDAKVDMLKESIDVMREDIREIRDVNRDMNTRVTRIETIQAERSDD